MHIKELLSTSNVIADARAPDKARLLQDLAKRAASALALDEDSVADAILKREALGSTGTGGGIAVPHARLDGVTRPFGILARLKKPIPFDAIDAKPVDIVFFMLLPTASAAEQLSALAGVTRKLRRSETVAALRQAADATDIFAIMANDEAG